jgi:hypothetical protein
MSAAQRLDNVLVSLFLQDRPGSHSFIDNQSRPVLSGSIYNPSDSDITIVIPAKSRAYLPGLFANAKFADVKTKVTQKHVTIQLPIGGTVPVFNSGKVK